MKKVFILFFTTLCLFSISSCKSIIYSYGLIKYHTGGGTYTVIDLTDEGRQQEYIIVPSYVNGYKVDFLGMGSGFASLGNVKKIYIPYDIIRWHDSSLVASPTKVFILSNEIHDFMSDYSHLYISNWLYENVELINSYSKKEVKDSIIYDAHISNVSFHFNYEGAPNEGYYWIDDYDYGELITFIPPNPIREGYTFVGWYKESECINEWIFNEDKLPEVQYAENGDILFNETELYAKWLNH